MQFSPDHKFVLVQGVLENEICFLVEEIYSNNGNFSFLWIMQEEIKKKKSHHVKI